MKRQRNTAQMKKQTRNTEVQINEEEIGNLPEKEFRVISIKMIHKLRNRIEAQIEEIQEMFTRT